MVFFKQITEASKKAMSAAWVCQTDGLTLSTLDKSTYMCHSKTYHTYCSVAFKKAW